MFSSIIDVFRYSRFGFRPLPVPCEPKGPNVNWAPQLKVLMAGNKLKLKLPRHAPRRNAEQLTIKGDIIYDGVSRRTGNGIMGDDNWEFFKGVFRQWRFNGPWFSGVAGAVSFNLRVVEPVKPNIDVSYFHPRVFEHVLVSYLSSCFEHKQRDRQCLWRAPVNWLRRADLSVPAACFDVLPTEEGSPVHYCVFPVGNHYLAEMSFRFAQACPGFLAEKDQKISREPMWELVNNILDSMTLTLSPENQAKVDKIKAECPDYSLSETFPPLKWPVDGNTADQPPEPLKIHAS